MNNINLIHVGHKTDLSIGEIISRALEREKEIDLAVSLEFNFWEDIPEDFDANDYHLYFNEMKKEITKLLGEPVFDGSWKSSDHNDWRKSVCPTAFADFLVIWPTTPKKMYLRYSQIDKEGEIAISFGAENSKCRTNTGSEDEICYE